MYMSVFRVILQMAQLQSLVAWNMMHSPAAMAVAADSAVTAAEAEGAGLRRQPRVPPDANSGLRTQVPALDSVSWFGCVDELGPGAATGALKRPPVATTPICARAAADDGAFEVLARRCSGVATWPGLAARCSM